jgi:DNA-binding transcriptional MerR regulator
MRAPYLTSADVARITNVVPDTVRGWARRGRLVPVMTTPGGVRLFRREDAERIAEKRLERARPDREAGGRG